MAYLNDILGLLNLRENFGLGQQELSQRAREFEAQLGFTKEEAQRMARQWEQQLREQQARRLFQQQQTQQEFNAQQNQQNFLNEDRTMQVGRSNPTLLALLAGKTRLGQARTDWATPTPRLTGY